MSASASTKMSIPGSMYIKKIMEFFNIHYEISELYIEYIKGGCEAIYGKLCEFYQVAAWLGPKISWLPHPFPDYDYLPSYHYKDVFETVKTTQDRESRPPDDYFPRAALKKAYENGSLENAKDIEQLYDQYIVKKASRSISCSS